MNLKKCWRVILLGGLVVALSAPSAMAWTNQPVVNRHNSNFRGAAPHGAAYGYRGQRPAWNHGNAYGSQHRNQWQNRNQWNQRNAYGSDHRNAYGANHQGAWGQRQGAWGQRQESRQFNNPNFGRPYGSYNQYSNTAYRVGSGR